MGKKLFCFSVPESKGTAEDVLAGARKALADANVQNSGVNADGRQPQRLVVRTSDKAGARAALTAAMS